MNELYLIIPYEYKNIYYRLLYLLAIEGKTIIDDCNYFCNNKGNNIFTCWNLFQSALAANSLGDTKKAELFFNYIDKQLSYYAKIKNIVIPTINETNYPTIAVKPNGDNTFTISMQYNDYSKSLIFPDGSPTPPTPTTTVVYYGASTTINDEEVVLSDLTKTDSSIFNKEIFITTTNTKKYIWFVSSIELSFTAAGLPVTLDESKLNDLYYYHTDALIAGDDNGFVITKK